ncbi:helix-turn-helix domain-containing protein [uncultured Flavonifractor sp.]|uniref:helix-turn-helix domain-containing protein n=1 Tax=uncultured Flavonifractor sp. TaxID=1193534 RepID=UPI0034289F42
MLIPDIVLYTDEFLSRQFSERLASELQTRGLSLHALSTEAGIPVQRLSELCSGTSVVTLSEAVRVALSLCCTLDFLLGLSAL